MSETKMAVKDEETKGIVVTEAPMGFEDESADDMIIPRVKLVQALTPERKDKIADEGDIINSLTKEKLNGKVFVPVFKFNNNIEWKDRNDGGGIVCRAANGTLGERSDGTTQACATCKRCEFDNSKEGKEAAPKCTKYINFFGFFEGERMPIILSFSRTNFNEGKKLYSLAKVTMQNMWNHAYKLESKTKAKNGNEWFIMDPTSNGPTSQEDREYAFGLFKMYRDTITNLNFDIDDSTPAATTSASKEDVDAAEY